MTSMARRVIASAIVLAGPSIGTQAADLSTTKAEIAKSVDAQYSRIDALYNDIHQHPELGFQEVRTAAKLAGELKALGYDVMKVSARPASSASTRMNLARPSWCVPDSMRCRSLPSEPVQEGLFPKAGNLPLIYHLLVNLNYLKNKDLPAFLPNRGTPPGHCPSAMPRSADRADGSWTPESKDRPTGTAHRRYR